MGDGRLIGERVSAVGVDVTEGLFWVVFVKKSAGSEVQGFAGDGHVVGVHDAMDEADAHPVCDEQGLAGADGFEECQIAVGSLVLSAIGVVSFDHVLREGGEGVDISACGEVFKGADADVTFCNAGEDGSGQGCFSEHEVACGHCGEGTGGRDIERVERFADEVFSEHGAEGGAAIAAAGEAGWSSAFELDIAEGSVGEADLSEEHGSSVPKLGNEVSELMAGVGLRDGG